MENRAVRSRVLRDGEGAIAAVTADTGAIAAAGDPKRTTAGNARMGRHRVWSGRVERRIVEGAAGHLAVVGRLSDRPERIERLKTDRASRHTAVVGRSRRPQRREGLEWNRRGRRRRGRLEEVVAEVAAARNGTGFRRNRRGRR